MTAALPEWDVASDAELAGAAAAGDRAAMGGIYDRYADRLHDFCVGMLRDREAAADCLQEVFCTAAAQLPKLREPGKLRPWLYAIARNEALRSLRLLGREDVPDGLPEQSSDAVPDTLARRRELAALVGEAAGGLSDRDRAVLELSYRHGLDGAELAEALGLSADNAAKVVTRLRQTVEHALGALLVARQGQRNPQGCRELGDILADWDGQFSAPMGKRIARHIDSCATCERSRRDLVEPKALLGVAPIVVSAPWWLRGQTLSRAQLTSADAGGGSESDAETMFGAPTDTLDRQPIDALGGPDSDSHRVVHSGPVIAYGAETEPDAAAQLEFEDAEDHRTRWIVSAVVLLGILVIAGGVVLWLQHPWTKVTPSNVIKTTQTTPAPAPTSAPPPVQTAPSSPPPPEPAPSSEPPQPPPPRPPTQTIAPSYTPRPMYTPTPRAPISTPSAEAPPPSATPPPWLPPGLTMPPPWTPPTWSPPVWTPPQLPGMTPAPNPFAPPSNPPGR